jgi:hypothetical protein
MLDERYEDRFVLSLHIINILNERHEQQDRLEEDFTSSRCSMKHMNNKMI